MKKLLIIIAFLFSAQSLRAQDTLRISPAEYLDIAFANSGQVAYSQTQVDLAQNRVEQVGDQRWMPELRMTSDHTLVPGVNSPNGFPEDQIYLDPDARNDWTNLGLFTRFRLSGAQPVFTWGAINKAVDAARIAVKASQQEMEADKEALRLKLAELYYAYVLALEVERLVTDAEDKIAQIERAFDRLLEESPEEVDESDRFKLKVFKSRFEIQKAELQQGLIFVKESWRYALRNDEGIIYEPSIRYLETEETPIMDIGYYQNSAKINRPELKGLEYGEDALEMYISSLKSQNLPGLYFGFTTTFASTPIRPRQENPFINEPGNTFFSTALGFSIRQNLNFFQMRTNLERTRLEQRRVSTLKDAATDGIILEVNEAFRNANVARERMMRTGEALVTTKEWLRMEQLDYDLGFGEGKDLIDAMRQELELRLEEKQSIFEFRNAIFELNKSAGLPLISRQSN